MLRDVFGQAVEAMKNNGRRTAITIVGMAWGIATVVLLLAYGAGFGRAFETIFAQFGTNMIGVFPGRTSEQAGGSKAGIKVRFQQEASKPSRRLIRALSTSLPSFGSRCLSKTISILSPG